MSPNSVPAWVWVICSLALAVALGLHVLFVYRHTRKPGPLNQKKKLMLVIAFIVPVYEITSYFIVFFPHLAFYLMVVQHLYEPFVLYSFFHLLVALLGGKEHAIQILAMQQPAKIYAQPPCCCFLRFCTEPTTMTPRMYEVFTYFALQLVVLAPIFSIIELILYWTGRDTSQVVKSFDSVSALFALYALFVLWSATREALAKHQTGLKFLSVKLGIVLVAIQSQILSLLVKENVVDAKDDLSPEDRTNVWQAFLILIEFAFVAVLHLYAFPVGEFDESLLADDDDVEVQYVQHL